MFYKIFDSVFVLSSCIIIVTVIDDVQNAAIQSVGVKNALYEVPGLGNRPVRIRYYPGVESVQSDLYEIYSEPYSYDLRAQLAVAVLVGEDESDVRGELLLIQRHPPTGPTVITGNITGLTSGRHGIHIHESGDMRKGCEKLGGHLNPFFLRHGSPRDALRHLGDLGNIEAGEEGAAEVNMVDPLVSLSLGPRGVVGRAIVITTDADDLGRGGSADSLTNGESGKPVACGVIAYIR